MSRVVSELGKLWGTTMSWGFNNTDNYITVPVAQMREAAHSRLQAAQRRLTPHNASEAFRRAASNNNSQDGLVGSLLFSLLTWVPFMDMLGEMDSSAADAFDFLNNPFIAAAADGLSLVFDEKASRNRTFKDGIYHGGRRQDRIISPMSKSLNGKFNLLAANENARFNYDAGAEVACLSELIEKLDDLEKQGVSLIRMDPRQSVSTVLKQSEKNMRNDKAMRRFAAPVRMAIV